MKKLTEREVQLGELEILKVFASICERLELRYILMYGTLIGAVRHHGFIPWDDDIDVAMPRPDYEKLVAHLVSHEQEIQPLRLMSYHTNKNYIYPISRLCDTRYHIDYKDTVDYGLGLFIDIYPMDGCGNTPEEFAKLVIRNRKLVKLVALSGCDKFQKSKTSSLRTPIKFAAFFYAKLCGSRYFIRKLEENSKKISFEESRFVDCTIWSSVDFGFNKEMFDETEFMQFEDSQFRVPKSYDAVLRRYYGDYMKLPSEEERIGHHYYTAYKIEE